MTRRIGGKIRRTDGVGGLLLFSDRGESEGGHSVASHCMAHDMAFIAGTNAVAGKIQSVHEGANRTYSSVTAVALYMSPSSSSC